jgi:protein phosphatase
MVCETFLSAFANGAETLPQRLVAALDASNRALARKVEEDPLLSGMGSTVIGAAFGPEGLQWVSVGDSPLFLYRRGEMALLNEDHSLAPELDRLAAAGRITQTQARTDPRRHMLRSAVTGEEMELVDVSRRALALEPGDYVILASDGLQTLEPDEIVRIIDAFASAGPQAVADALIREVDMMRDEHQDNATVVAVRPVFDE